jgi:hypothetical protein
MVDNNSSSAQSHSSDGAHWSTYLAIALVSGFMGVLSFYFSIFSINEFLIALSIGTSVVIFIASMVLVSYGRVTTAFAISSCNLLIFICLGLTAHLVTPLVEDLLKVASRIENPFGAQAALERAVREGELRKATHEDLGLWREAYLAKKSAQKDPSAPVEKDARIGSVELSQAYIVLRKFALPWGPTGSNRAVFFVPKGVPLPTGEMGRSAIYDFDTLTVQCTFARTESFSC